MASGRYEVIIIYGNGMQSRMTIGATSEGDAYAKGKAAASGSALNNKGVDQIIVNKL